MKTALLAVAALLVAVTSACPTKCTAKPVKVTGAKGQVQCDYSNQAKQHWKKIGSTHHLWGYTSDNSLSRKSDTYPRAEISL